MIQKNGCHFKLNEQYTFFLFNFGINSEAKNLISINIKNGDTEVHFFAFASLY